MNSAAGDGSVPLVGDLPFDKPGRFYKGNLHSHSTNSEGTLPPKELARLYREAGYDFLAVTDHFRQRYDFPITETCPYRREGFATLLGTELHAPETTLGEDWHILDVGLPPDFPRRAQTSWDRTSHAGRRRPRRSSG